MDQKLSDIKKGLEKAYSYLTEKTQPRTVCIKRSSGVAHKVKLKPNTKGKQISFSKILILFGKGDQFPIQTMPKKSKGGGNQSITAQYETDPSKFRYYDKFGIFEIYDK